MLFSVKQYLQYLYLVLSNKRTSNSFINDFISKVLHNKTEPTQFLKIEKLKKKYQFNEINIRNEDYGAGSKKRIRKNTLTSAHLLKTASISSKNGTLLHHLALHFNSRICIELGTCLGIGSSYLSNKNNKVISIEGNRELAKLSKISIKDVGINNIEIINGKFDDVLKNILTDLGSFDLLFVDGNHTEEATIAYFELALNYTTDKSIIVFDDINWSIGMKNAWNTIIKHQEIRVSIDLFRQGIVFFDKTITNKEHFTLWH